MPDRALTRICYVEDDEDIQRIVRMALERIGKMTVEVVTDPMVAIGAITAFKPDLVMLDLLMPDVNGFDVVEALSERDSTKSIPIMVLTAKHLTEAEIEQLNRHVSAILRRGSTAAVDLLGQLEALLWQGQEVYLLVSHGLADGRLPAGQPAVEIRDGAGELGAPSRD